jgi:hypothetical protein
MNAAVQPARLTFADLYRPHTAPFQHQYECLERSYAKRAFAYLMDPGLGKTKVTIDLTALWYLAGHIRGLLVLAYNEVHRQWVEEQIPLHWSPTIPLRAVVWESSNARALRLTKAIITSTAKAVHVLSMNHEALSTKTGRQQAKLFLQAHRSLFVLDDSHEFKTPAARRTQNAQALSDLAFGRRILTGTLTGGDPFNAFAQFRFLDPRILGCDSFLSFKHQYGVFTERTVSKGVNPATGRRKLQTFEELQEYQNLDQLNALMAPYVYSKHKEDCADLPPKLPQVVPTHLSKAQRELYRRLAEDGLALLERAEGGASVRVADPTALDEGELAERVTAASNRVTYRIKLTLLLRLQQCAAGIVTDDAGRTQAVDGLFKHCPRYVDLLQWLRQTLSGSKGKVILWANYRPVLEALQAMIRAELPQAGSLLIHGGVTGAVRQAAVNAFKDPHSEARVLTAHPRVMGTGQNFEVATSVMFFTRSFSLFQRTQAEDRAHRLSSTGTVTIADMVARDAPTDHKEMDTLRRKLDLVSTLESFNSKALREMLTC